MSQFDGWLPLIALLISAVALFAGKEVTAKSPPKIAVKAGLCGAGVLIVLLLWLYQRNGGANADVSGVIAAAVLGALGAACAEWLPQVGKAVRSVVLAFAAFDLSIASYFGTTAPLAYVFGLAVTAWLMSMRSEASLAMRTCFAAAGIASCDMLGQMQSPPIAHAGIWIALAAVVAGVVAEGIGRPVAKMNPWLKYAFPVLLFALYSGIGFLLFQKLSAGEAMPVLFLRASLVALVVAWFAEGEESLTRVILGSILWLGVATASFGYERGFGMSIALMAGLGISLSLNRPKSLLCLAPFATVVIYRVFYGLQPQFSSAFDIGQHYALMGLLLGVLVPVLATEWLRSQPSDRKRLWIAALLWVLILAAAPVPVAVAFSDRGIIGYIVGLGLAAVIEAPRRRALDTMSLGLGLAAGMVMLYGWLEPHIDLDRTQKIRALYWIVGLIALAGIGIGLLSRPERQATEAS
jgi:hypothetical protein